MRKLLNPVLILSLALAFVTQLALAAATKEEAAKTAVEAYVEGELISGDLFSFCQNTRPYVRIAPDYPNCPPHDALTIIKSAKVTQCAVAQGTGWCSVEYRVVATLAVGSAPPQIKFHKAIIKQKIFVSAGSNEKTPWLIQDPYLPPKVGKAAVTAQLMTERALAKGLEYPHELAIAIRKLSAVK